MSNADNRRPLHPERIVDPRTAPFAPAKFRGYLPHLSKDGCTYFVTFCLADVVSERRLTRRLLTGYEEPDEIAASFEPRPRAGACALGDFGLARMVESSLLHFQKERYALSAWCVMPNHVHVVITPYDRHPLGRILHSWKSFTAHTINRHTGGSGPVWQEESFDHLVRDETAFEKFVAYTEMNPVAAGLVERPELWPFSSAPSRSRAEVDFFEGA